MRFFRAIGGGVYFLGWFPLAPWVKGSLGEDETGEAGGNFGGYDRK